MSDFYEVNVEVKIKHNVGQISETIKDKDMSGLVTMEAFSSKDVSSRVSSRFIVLAKKISQKKMSKKILLK